MNDFNYLFAPVELAGPLKELGFNMPVIGYWFPNPNHAIGERYDWVYKDYTVGRDIYTIDHQYKMKTYSNTIPAPLYNQVFDWLEIKDLRIHDCWIFKKQKWTVCLIEMSTGKHLWPDVLLKEIQTGDYHFINKIDGWNLAIEQAIKLLNKQTINQQANG